MGGGGGCRGSGARTGLRCGPVALPRPTPRTRLRKHLSCAPVSSSVRLRCGRPSLAGCGEESMNECFARAQSSDTRRGRREDTGPVPAPRRVIRRRVTGSESSRVRVSVCREAGPGGDALVHLPLLPCHSCPSLGSHIGSARWPFPLCVIVYLSHTRLSPLGVFRTACYSSFCARAKQSTQPCTHWAWEVLGEFTGRFARELP